MADDPLDVNTAPLAGVRILDLTPLLPGPFCTLALADLGADVVKVEPPHGDEARRMASDLYTIANRNKRSVVLDLKTGEGLDICRRLARRADVFVEAFRPGVTERLGLGYEQVRALQPSIVYCSISGFGQQGPMAMVPGHDANYLAEGGALSYSGHWGELPRRSGVPLADVGVGLYAAVSILAALRRAEHEGQGTYIDLSLADAAMAVATCRGGADLRLRNDEQLHLYPTNDVFDCADGRQIAIGAVEQRFWESLRRVLAPYDDRLADPRFDDEAGRRRHGDELKALVVDVCSREPSGYWLERFDEEGVPGTLVRTLDEAATSPHARARGLVHEADGQRHVVFPALWDGQPIASVRWTAPELGAHTDEVLADQAWDPESSEPPRARR